MLEKLLGIAGFLCVSSVLTFRNIMFGYLPDQTET